MAERPPPTRIRHYRRMVQTERAHHAAARQLPNQPRRRNLRSRPSDRARPRPLHQRVRRHQSIALAASARARPCRLPRTRWWVAHDRADAWRVMTRSRERNPTHHRQRLRKRRSPCGLTARAGATRAHAPTLPQTLAASPPRAHRPCATTCATSYVLSVAPRDSIAQPSGRRVTSPCDSSPSMCALNSNARSSLQTSDTSTSSAVAWSSQATSRLVVSTATCGAAHAATSRSSTAAVRST